MFWKLCIISKIIYVGIKYTMKTKTKKIRRKERKQRKTRFHRKNRKLRRFFSILENNRKNALMVGGEGLKGFFTTKTKEQKAEEAKKAAEEAEKKADPVKYAKKINLEQEKELQQKENFGKTDPTDQEKLLAQKDLKSAFAKSEEEKLTKAMKYQRTYSEINNVMEATGKTALAFAVANATVGVLAATGIGLPAAGGIAVCLIIISKIMKKVKELQELRIVMLDMNIILTNCYYLENMINKVLTIFQIYINDTTSDKKYFKKIITVDEYTELNNSCKNIKMLVDENKTNKNNIDDFISVASNTIGNIKMLVDENKTNKKPKYSDFIKKTKNLKGYNLGERIQNAKQLYIENHNIDDVINAEKAEYEIFGKALNKTEDYINIDDDDALESLMKYTIYRRIENGLKSCNTDTIGTDNKDTSGTDNKDTIVTENTSGIDKFYDKESKHIYQIGIDPDIKFRIKQKLNIIRDLLIEIDPTAAQDIMKSVDLNESLDKVEEKAFAALILIDTKKLKDINEINRKKKFSECLEKYTTPKGIFISNKIKNFDEFIKNYIQQYENKYEIIKTETDLNTFLEKEKNTIIEIETINKILNYWLQMKQYGKTTDKEEKITDKEDNNKDKEEKITDKEEQEKIKKFLKLHDQEWRHFLKICFLKMEFYKEKQEFKDKNKNTKDITEEDANIYANYENWVRNYLKLKKPISNTNTFRSVFSIIGVKKDDGVISATNLATAKNKTNMLMNTLNSLNAMFIIVNSQFEMTLKYYERALRNDELKNSKENAKENGFDRVWDLCESTVAYQKLLLPPDFNEDKQAILDQVEMSDFINDTSTDENENTDTSTTTDVVVTK